MSCCTKGPHWAPRKAALQAEQSAAEHAAHTPRKHACTLVMMRRSPSGSAGLNARFVFHVIPMWTRTWEGLKDLHCGLPWSGAWLLVSCSSSITPGQSCVAGRQRSGAAPAGLQQRSRPKRVGGQSARWAEQLGPPEVMRMPRERRLHIPQRQTLTSLLQPHPTMPTPTPKDPPPGPGGRTLLQ